MATSNLLKAAGLQTFNNNLTLPDGALSQADNANIDREGIIESRRGFKQYGPIGTDNTKYAKQLLVYKDRILAHYPNSKLAWDNGSGIFTDFNQTIDEVMTGLRMKYIELNGNLYMTTSNGIKKISVLSANDFSTTTILDSGVPRALGLNVLLDNTSLGFLESQKTVGYRVVWATKDPNGNLIYGFPSALVEVSNPGTSSAVAKIRFSPPNDITEVSIRSTFFYQVYRTAMVSISGTVDDELKLVYEGLNDMTTNFNVGGGYYEIQDLYPETLRVANTNLYTNIYSGEGIANANVRPPISKDITTYKNYTFLGNVKGRHTLNNTLLGVSAFSPKDVTGISIPTAGTVRLHIVGHGFTGTPKIVLAGTTALDGIYTAAVHDVDNLDITTSVTTLTTVTGGSVVYSDYLFITKGAVTNRYWPIGRRFIANITFVHSSKAQYNDDWINLYSSENRTHYVIWFDSTGTNLIPPSGVPSSNVAYIRIDLSSASITNNIHIANAFRDVVNSSLYDFELNINDSITSNIVKLDTSSSGKCTDWTSSATSPTTPDTTISIVQQGIGIAYAVGSGANDKFFMLSTYTDPGAKNEETTKSFLDVLNANDNEEVYGYYVSSSNGLPGEFNLESVALDNITFTLDANTSSVDKIFNTELPQNSSSEENKNRLVYSKQSEPDAYPLVNYFDVGPKDKEIKRIIGLRDSLFVFKEEGIYRLYGTDSSNFSVVLFDSSSNIAAPDSAVVLNNQIYLLTTQGAARVSETGVQIISRPIEDIFTSTSTINNYDSISFGVSYEADRSYLLFVPNSSEDTTATKAYRFNTYTGVWTSWNRNYNCGTVLGRKLYFGAVVDNYVEVERKDLTRSDYSDRSISGKDILSQVGTSSLILSSRTNVAKGDSILQTQYLTISQYNQLLYKLETDVYLNTGEITKAHSCDNMNLMLSSLVSLLNTKDLSLYVAPSVTFANGSSLVTTSSTHSFLAGDYIKFDSVSGPTNIVSNVYYKVIAPITNNTFTLANVAGSQILANNNGTGTNCRELYYDSGISTFATLQTEFNGMIDKLNLSQGVFFSNYKHSTGTTQYEAHITETSPTNNTVSIDTLPPFIIGPFSLEKGIPVAITWAPRHFGNVDVMKHVREGKIIFESTAFQGGTLGFNTDLSPEFEDTDFTLSGDGSWGTGVWGDFNWGGEGTQVPFRTLIPRQKQRCRFIRSRFKHINARNKFVIYGISYTFEIGSDRAWK